MDPAEGGRTPVRLSYARADGADQCPSAEDVRRAVSAHLGYEPFDDEATTVVAATVAGIGGGLEARVELWSPTGEVIAERRIASARSDCEELSSAMVLAIAIALDPVLLARPTGAAVAQPVAPARPSPPPSVPSTAALEAEVAPASTPSGALAYAGPILSIGASPDPTAGLVLGGGVFVGAWSIALEGRADLESSTEAFDERVSASLVVASLVPCRRFSSMRGCLLVTAGAVHGAGPAREVATPFLGLGGRAAWEAPLTDRLSVGAWLDVIGALARTSLLVQGEREWRTPAVSAALGLSTIGRFE